MLCAHTGCSVQRGSKQEGGTPVVQPVMHLGEVPDYVKAEVKPVQDESWGMLENADNSEGDARTKRKRTAV